MMQWQAFNQTLLNSLGFNDNFFPFDRPILPMEVKFIPSQFKGLFYVGCKDKVNKHTDGELLNPYLAMLIVRDNGLIAKSTACGKNKLQPQIPGTIIVLNIFAYHHCIRDLRILRKRSALWIALACDFDRLPEQATVEDKFRELLFNGTR
jgi:hypothetical protein